MAHPLKIQHLVPWTQCPRLQTQTNQPFIKRCLCAKSFFSLALASINKHLGNKEQEITCYRWQVSTAAREGPYLLLMKAERSVLCN